MTSRSLSIAVVDEELPYPPTSGKRIRTLSLIERLAARHRITILAHRNADEDEAKRARRYLEDRDIAVHLVNHPTPPKSTLSQGPRFYARLARNLLSPRPYVVDVNCSKALRQAIEAHDGMVHFDAWHFEWTPYAAMADDGLAQRSVVVAHNVESLIWQRYWETERNPAARWYIRRQWKKFERFERKTFGRVRRVVAVSDADAALIQTRFGRADVDVVENGVDIDCFRPADTDRTAGRILFLGSLDWRPNLDGAKWLLDEVFPRVSAKLPGVTLAVVGRCPPRWLVERIRNVPNATLHADVPDVRPYLAGAAAMVVPLRIGGGTRLKILEAAAAGLPVVSTSVGAEGLKLEPGVHYLRADSAGDLSAALCQCLENPDASSMMAHRARQRVVTDYAWDELAQKLEQVWLACAESRRPRQSAVVGRSSLSVEAGLLHGNS